MVLNNFGERRRRRKKQRQELPKRPWTVRIALILVYVVIALRLAFLFDRLGGLADFELAEVGGGRGATMGPAMGLATLWMLPVVLVARRLMRRGYGWAMWCYVSYLVIRIAALLVRSWGPSADSTLALTLAMVGCCAALLSPSSRKWFADCDRQRASTTVMEASLTR